MGDAPGDGVDSDDDASLDSSDDGSPPIPETTSCQPEGLPDPLLRRLTRNEYANTVHDLLGYEGDIASAFPDDQKIHFFNDNSIAPVTELFAERYMEAAETLATFAATRLSALLPCDPDEEERSCAESFIEHFGSRAFRRPLEAVEVDGYLRLYDAERAAEAPFSDGVTLIVQTMLQSPHFLYRRELGVGDTSRGMRALGAHELSSRLSYFLWGSMPDEELAEAATNGTLLSPTGLQAQAERLLASPRATATITSFHRQWLGVEQLARKEKDEKLYPGYNANIAASLAREFDRLIEHVFHDGDGSLETLMTAPYTFVERDVAALYGIENVGGSEPVRVEDDTPRAGLLTQGSVLATYANANQTSPVQRGYFIRKHLLCQDPPPPPPNVATDPPEFNPNLPTRVRFAQHRDDPNCRACHEMLDPLGFGLESFDAIGRFRTTDGGEPIDASGEIKGTDVDGMFDGAPELGARLAGSTTLRACAAKQWAQFALGRGAEAELGCASEATLKALTVEGGDVYDGIIALVTSDAFRLLKADEGSLP